MLRVRNIIRPLINHSARFYCSDSETYVDKADVVIVGGGPAGLSAAIRLKQKNADLRVILVEKASEIGAHILSGCVFQPTSLNELLPEWKTMGAPIKTPVTSDTLYFLTKDKGYGVPYHPNSISNEGNYIISLSKLVRWLGQQAEELGVELYPGIAASKILYDENGSVKGIKTNDLGVSKSGKKKDTFQEGMELHADCTLFAEGCRGSLTRLLYEKYDLRKGVSHQTYGIGIKEVWKLDDAKHKLGTVMHTIGWPLDTHTYGGGFIYHWEDNQLSIGFVSGLDYKNPYFNPYKEFQRWKHHPLISPLFEGAQCISYGARAISEGGYQSIPKLFFPGGALIGDTAGFLNVPKIKGTHTAMKSGILAADSIIEKLENEKDKSTVVLDNYTENFKKSWLHDELYAVRNFRPAFKYGLYAGLAIGGLNLITQGKIPGTISHHAVPDDQTLIPAAQATKIEYPKPDGKISFDLLTNLSRSNTNHDEDQPCHLTLVDKSVPVDKNLKVYDGPEQRFCPANVYEFVKDEKDNYRLQINQSNCIHCKTCDIKDSNINWVTPEGGGGPIYENM